MQLLFWQPSHQVRTSDPPQLPNTKGWELAGADQTVEGVFADSQFPLDVLRCQELVIGVYGVLTFRGKECWIIRNHKNQLLYLTVVLFHSLFAPFAAFCAFL